MKKLKYIFVGFFRLILSSLGLLKRDENEILAEQRYEICQACEFRKGIACGICGCHIRAKSKAIYKLDNDGKSIDGCPKKYW